MSAALILPSAGIRAEDVFTKIDYTGTQGDGIPPLTARVADDAYLHQPVRR
jgi:hypothetical protein